MVLSRLLARLVNGGRIPKSRSFDPLTPSRTHARAGTPNARALRMTRVSEV